MPDLLETLAQARARQQAADADYRAALEAARAGGASISAMARACGVSRAAITQQLRRWDASADAEARRATAVAVR